MAQCRECGGYFETLWSDGKCNGCTALEQFSRVDDLENEVEELKRELKALKEAPLVAAGKLPPPIPKR
jgi:predicted ATP-dependent serine protease